MSRLQNGIPDMSNQLALARQADQLGFSALWLRDVPLFDREFNDAGQVYDPWVWLGQLATVTEHIALSTAGIVLPLRHPVQWIAQRMDGWLTYFRPLHDQLPRIQLWRGADHGQGKERLRPFAQSFFIDPTDDPDTAPSPIFLGYRLGRNQLLKELEALKAGGANHVMFNLRYSTRPAMEVVEELSKFILPAYPRLNDSASTR